MIRCTCYHGIEYREARRETGNGLETGVTDCWRTLLHFCHLIQPYRHATELITRCTQRAALTFASRGCAASCPDHVAT